MNKKRRSYEASPKGKARRRRYATSTKGKITQKTSHTRYAATPKGKAARRRYAASPKGKAARIRHAASPKGKATRRRYAASPKGRKHSRIFVAAEYSAERHGWGVLDRKIEHLARGSCVGSGTSATSGYRDIQFEYATERGAKNALQRLRKAFRGYRLRVCMWSTE